MTFGWNFEISFHFFCRLMYVLLTYKTTLNEQPVDETSKWWQKSIIMILDKKVTFSFRHVIISSRSSFRYSIDIHLVKLRLYKLHRDLNDIFTFHVKWRQRGLYESYLGDDQFRYCSHFSHDAIWAIGYKHNKLNCEVFFK